MKQEVQSFSEPWTKEQLLKSSLMTDPIFGAILERGYPLTRESYLELAFGDRTAEPGPEQEASIPWDFQNPETRRPKEEVEVATLEDLRVVGLIKSGS